MGEKDESEKKGVLALWLNIGHIRDAYQTARTDIAAVMTRMDRSEK
jgi:hypothetical protein